MLALLAQWILSAIALVIVSRIVPGFHVTGFGPALFLLVINALMIELASSVVHGFHVRGFWPAFWGGIVLSLIGMLIRAIVKD
jgi:putative membrane protein